MSEHDSLQKLLDLFKPLIDEALIVAIANDHDLTQPEEYQLAHSTLQSLSQDVVLEESTGFNPSGILPDARHYINAGHDDRSASVSSASQHSSEGPKASSSGTDASSAAADGADFIPRLTSFNNDSYETKILNLQSMFSELKEYDIKHALKQAHGDFQNALEILLQVQYLQSIGQRKKGIDGFFDDGMESSHKRKGKKLKPIQVIPPYEIQNTPTPEDEDKKLKHQDDISYLADRIDMTYDQISSIYYSKRCSSGATAAEIIEQYLELGITAGDEESKIRAKELAAKYRHVPARFMSTVVQVTPMLEFSDDIASLLDKHFTKNPWKQRLDLNYRLSPLPSDELDDSASGQSSKARSPVPKSPLSPRFTGPSDLPQAFQKSQQYAQASRDANAYAAQLVRRGGSNSLYRQAAVVWSERGREHAQASHNMTSVAAEHLVSQQSTAFSIDLHGVTVLDGTRIARQRVQSWWDSLGEAKVKKAREQNYTVITGYGRHSGGVSRLRQAVAAALLQDGWKIEVETGRFRVTGRR